MFSQVLDVRSRYGQRQRDPVFLPTGNAPAQFYIFVFRGQINVQEEIFSVEEDFRVGVAQLSF
ncbi:hypothetical protein [Desulfofundulus thermocisternus]|uniref:hypothetical protein n=1 Tax=Desulfofundulus thermocisternus TaxID=42471 RepID=UPI001A098CB1|nr:hypothetical protein [Desulfofundulus thermocisternus]MBE3585219.1 hypothetical protein [Thermoanaerobacter sp.]